MLTGTIVYVHSKSAIFRAQLNGDSSVDFLVMSKGYRDADVGKSTMLLCVQSTYDRCAPSKASLWTSPLIAGCIGIAHLIFGICGVVIGRRQAKR
jgi:hypothetical protein